MGDRALRDPYSSQHYSDTEFIALLIEERDQILENLEIAETRYISSFRLTTPDPSLADWEPPQVGDPDRPVISRPRPLRNSVCCFSCGGLIKLELNAHPSVVVVVRTLLWQHLRWHRPRSLHLRSTTNSAACKVSTVVGSLRIKKDSQL